MAKGASKKLDQAAKKKECALISPWIKSVVNHMYWIAARCGKDSALKKAKWSSIVNHLEMTLCKNAYAICNLFKGCKNDYFR